jgi:hypothetical protein
VSDSPDSLPEPPEAPGASSKPEFTKEPQPDLPLELRKQKAGWNWNRFIIWLAVGGFALYLIITGIVGILTKAR